MTTLAQQTQQLSIAAALVELYILDCTALGGDLHRFTPNIDSKGGPVMWGGVPFFPLPIASDGWEYCGDGSQKKPNLQLSNVNKTIQAEVITLGDIVGAKVTRYRTFSNFLDNGATPDPTQYFQPDVYYIEQKTHHDNEFIVWSLCSVIDRMGMKIPRRQITKDGDSRYCRFPGVGAYRPTSV